MSVTNGGNRATAVRVAGINAGDHLKFIPILNIVSGCGNCGALSSLLLLLLLTPCCGRHSLRSYTKFSTRVSQLCVYTHSSGEDFFLQLYCTYERHKIAAWRPRGACARDFVNFRKKKFMHRARAVRPRGFDS
jgi:hypothetical protein